MIYANHAGTSWPKPTDVLEAIAAALERSPGEAPALFESAREEVCRFLGIVDLERFLFTSGCTSSLSVAIGDLPWRDGDVVLTSALEHHALARPVEQLEGRGVRHLVAPYRPGAPLDLDFVRDALRREPVRLIAVSAASNVTGELLPVAELCRLAREHDALCLVDAAQTVGVVPLDVAELAPDILALAGHKGPQGPQGIGGLWAAPQVAFASPRASCEIGASACAPFPGYCDVGSVNLAGAAGLAAGLRWIARRGIEATGGRARRLADGLVAALRERPHCTVLGGQAGDRTAVVSVRIDGLALERAEAFFERRGIVVRAGQHCAPLALEAIGEPAGTLRISFGASSGAGDPEAILAAVDEVPNEREGAR